MCKISLKVKTKKGNPTNKISLSIQNSRKGSLLKHTSKSSSRSYKSLSRLKCKFETKETSLRTEHSNGATRDNLTSRLIPECDVFLTNHGVKAREPFGASGHVVQTDRIHEPRVLQASILHQQKDMRWANGTTLGLRVRILRIITVLWHLP
jgi:hypothetical protein